MNQRILTEGNDLHVVLQVCMKHGLTGLPKGFVNKKDFEQNFAVKSNRREAIGKKEMFLLIPDALQTPDLKALGVILDADKSAASTWQSVCAALQKCGYTNLSASPDANGTIVIDSNPDLPKVGIWIMPDNRNPGEIEDFFLQLIDREDFRLNRARKVIADLIVEKPDFKLDANRSKAETHTWLAWQQDPGRSMGVAIKNNWMSAEHPLAARFAAWFSQLFELEDRASHV